MHRTTSTTATLLVTVAVSALTGCVTLQHPPAPGPPAVPASPSAPATVPLPRPDGRAGTRVAQAPALEALERVGTRRAPEPSAPPRARRATPPAPAASTPAAAQPAPRTAPQPLPRTVPPPHPRTRPARPERPEPARPASPRGEVSDGREEVERNTDVCALGRRYGGWRSDSPEAVICEQAY
ncbi:hypothetical protein [Streptomyces sp. NPDC088812]|uniref:hypothetical protein n=1 Tax=Streptomyces sp. NPDC088812 TaxID=3365905 RepID=UPI0037FF25C1